MHQLFSLLPLGSSPSFVEFVIQENLNDFKANCLFKSLMVTELPHRLRSRRNSQMMLHAKDHPHWELSRNGNNNLSPFWQKITLSKIKVGDA